MSIKLRWAVIATALATLASISVGLTMVGKEARVVDVLALFASGFGVGASFASIRYKAANNKSNATRTSTP